MTEVSEHFEPNSSQLPNHAKKAGNGLLVPAADEQLRTRVLEEGVCVSQKRGDYLCEEGKSAANIYALIEGSAGVSVRSEPPARHYLFFISAGSLIIPALDSSGQSTITVECLSASRCFMISRLAMERSLEGDTLTRSAIELNLVGMLDRANHHISNLLCRSGAARVAHLLLDLSPTIAKLPHDLNTPLAIQLTQVDLASALGMSPVYLNQILKVMKEDGLIELVSGKITIIDTARLQFLSH